jgi:hypothetical protein
MITTWTILHKIAKETLGFVSFYLSSWRILFLIPLFLSMKTLIFYFGQFTLTMGNNGSVATVILDEGDGLVFHEWPSQGIASLIDELQFL